MGDGERVAGGKEGEEGRAKWEEGATPPHVWAAGVLLGLSRLHLAELHHASPSTELRRAAGCCQRG